MRREKKKKEMQNGEEKYHSCQVNGLKSNEESSICEINPDSDRFI